MHGLPRDFDFAAFHGRTIEQISFAAYLVVLSFGEDLWLQVESSLSYRLDPHQPDTFETIPISRSGLMVLIGKTVERADTPGDGTLALHFEDGARFQCFDDKPMYECYQLWIGGRRVIV